MVMPLRRAEDAKPRPMPARPQAASAMLLVARPRAGHQVPVIPSAGRGLVVAVLVVV